MPEVFSSNYGDLHSLLVVLREKLALQRLNLSSTLYWNTRVNELAIGRSTLRRLASSAHRIGVVAHIVVCWLVAVSAPPSWHSHTNRPPMALSSRRWPVRGRETNCGHWTAYPQLQCPFTARARINVGGHVSCYLLSMQMHVRLKMSMLRSFCCAGSMAGRPVRPLGRAAGASLRPSSKVQHA